MCVTSSFKPIISCDSSDSEIELIGSQDCIHDNVVNSESVLFHVLREKPNALRLFTISQNFSDKIFKTRPYLSVKEKESEDSKYVQAQRKCRQATRPNL